MHTYLVIMEKLGKILILLPMGNYLLLYPKTENIKLLINLEIQLFIFQMILEIRGLDQLILQLIQQFHLQEIKCILVMYKMVMVILTIQLIMVFLGIS